MEGVSAWLDFSLELYGGMEMRSGRRTGWALLGSFGRLSHLAPSVSCLNFLSQRSHFVSMNMSMSHPNRGIRPQRDAQYFMSPNFSFSVALIACSRQPVTPAS